MTDPRDRRGERATWPGVVHRGGWGDPPRIEGAAERIAAVFELSGWFDPAVPPLRRDATMPGRVIRPGDR